MSKIFDFTLTGLTPLLIHADDIIQGDALTEWRKDVANKEKSVAGDDRSPPWTWMTYLYSDGEVLTVPADNILASLRKAGASFILKKQTTYKELTQSGLVCLDEHFPLAGPKGPVMISAVEGIKELSFSQQAEKVKDLGFRLFAKRASVNQSKHVRVRARFDEWSLTGRIEITTPDISPEMFAKIFEYAGNRVGICDWRPSSKKSPGPFGRFSVKLKAA